MSGGTILDLVLIAPRLVTAEGERAAEIGIADGRIAAVAGYGAGLAGRERVEFADDEVLLPGLVDTHVHVNEPGRTEWEGFASASRAALAAGVTTIVDMPLNSLPPTVDVPALEIKRGVAADQVSVDTGFWGGAIPGNASDLKPLHEAGAYGFKCFLSPSGVDEFPPLTPEEMREAMRVIAEIDSLLIVHAEDPNGLESAPQAHGPGYESFLRSRPPAVENDAIAEVIAAARETGARVHILHLSSADALPMIADAKAEGIRLTVETCPHYLTLKAEEIPEGATAFKCCPPIREDGNRERLWQGLLDGVIDCIVSDHSPSTAERKEVPFGDFGTAWGGVASLQLGIPLIWTEAARRGLPLSRVIDWMSRRPAEIARLGAKGRVEVGADADFAVFAPDERFTVDVQQLQHKNKVTPYHGKRLQGVVRRTYLRGTAVTGAEPRGRLLSRN